MPMLRTTASAPALNALAAEIKWDYPTDEATPRLLAVIAAKAARMAEKN